MRILKMIFLTLIFFSCNVFAYSIDELLKELDTPQWREKISSFGFIEKLKNPEALSTVIALAEDRGINWRYRIRAIKLLGNIGTPQAEDALLRMFQDHFFHHECPSLKSYVADALGSFKPNKRLLEILKEGLTDAEVLVREATARSVGKLKMPESVKYLKEAFMKEKNEAVRIAIINSLKTIGSDEALSFINQLASDGQLSRQ